MGKGFNNYMTKKFFHPASKENIKRVWMADQKMQFEKKKQEDLLAQYQKEQEMYGNRALLGDEKAQMGLSFMYDAPPGMKKEKEKEEGEPEYKFEWQRKYNAPREAYAKDDETIRDQPFGIEVRNVRCIKCRKWGHVNTDKICPLFGKDLTAEPPQPSSSASSLLESMREDGFTLKQSILGKMSDPGAANEQLLDHQNDSDPEVQFLKSLTPKQKKKLLKKLNKLQKHEDSDKKEKKKKKKKKKDKKSEEPVQKKKSKRRKASSSDNESSDSEDDDARGKKIKKKRVESPSVSERDSNSDSDSDDGRHHKKHVKQEKTYRNMFPHDMRQNRIQSPDNRNRERDARSRDFREQQNVEYGRDFHNRGERHGRSSRERETQIYKKSKRPSRSSSSEDSSVERDERETDRRHRGRRSRDSSPYLRQDRSWSQERSKKDRVYDRNHQEQRSRSRERPMKMKERVSKDRRQDYERQRDRQPQRSRSHERRTTIKKERVEIDDGVDYERQRDRHSQRSRSRERQIKIKKERSDRVRPKEKQDRRSRERVRDRSRSPRGRRSRSSS